MLHLCRSFVFGVFVTFFFFIITLHVLRLFVSLWFCSLLAVLCLLLVIPFRLYNGSEHFPLSRSYHSFVFFCQGPFPRSIAQRRRDHHVEHAEPVLQEVSFWCPVERRPSSSNSNPDFCCLLLLKCYSFPRYLAQSLTGNTSTLMLLIASLLFFCSNFDC